MPEDARFEDSPWSDRPLRLRAETAEDLAVIASLMQDAVARVGDIAWMPRRRRLALVVNRFRWEDSAAATRSRRPFERVRTALVVTGVQAVRARGVDPKAKDTVVSLLSLAFAPLDGCAGRLTLALAGDGDLVAEVECLDVTLTDLTRPWQAHARTLPAHGD